MNKANFDMLKNLPVPEGWIENAVAIPEKEEKRKAVVPFWRNRAVIAAASLVLVSALSLLLYLSFGVKPPVEVKSSTPATEIVWSTDDLGETVATEMGIVPDSTTVQNGTQPTEPRTGVQQLRGQIFGTEIISPTTAPGVRGRTNPSTVTNPTTKPGSNVRGKTDPTTKIDTIVPPVHPTEKEPAPTTAPREPSTESPDEPTESPGPILRAARKKLLYVSVPTASVPADEIVYCKLQTDDGEVLGNDDLYDEEHRMTLLASGAKYTYYYVVSDNIEIPVDLEGSAVVYCIYDKDENILTTGSYQL